MSVENENSTNNLIGNLSTFKGTIAAFKFINKACIEDGPEILQYIKSKGKGLSFEGNRKVNVINIATIEGGYDVEQVSYKLDDGKVKYFINYAQTGSSTQGTEIEICYVELENIINLIEEFESQKSLLNPEIGNETDSTAESAKEAIELNNAERNILSDATKCLEDFKEDLPEYLQTGDVNMKIFSVFYNLRFLEKLPLFDVYPKGKVDSWIADDFSLPTEKHFTLMIARILRNKYSFTGKNGPAIDPMIQNLVSIRQELIISSLKVLFNEYGDEFRKIKAEHKS